MGKKMMPFFPLGRRFCYCWANTSAKKFTRCVMQFITPAQTIGLLNTFLILLVTYTPNNIVAKSTFILGSFYRIAGVFLPWFGAVFLWRSNDDVTYVEDEHQTYAHPG